MSIPLKAYHDQIVRGLLSYPRVRLMATDVLGPRSCMAMAAASLGPQTKILVVCATVLKTTWDLELEQAGAAKPQQVLPATRLDAMIPRLKGVEFDLLIAEISTQGTATAKKLGSLIEQSKRCWIRDLSLGNNYGIHELCETRGFTDLPL